VIGTRSAGDAAAVVVAWRIERAGEAVAATDMCSAG